MTKKTQTGLVSPVEKIYEVSFTTVSFAIAFLSVLIKFCG